MLEEMESMSLHFKNSYSARVMQLHLMASLLIDTGIYRDLVGKYDTSKLITFIENNYNDHRENRCSFSKYIYHSLKALLIGGGLESNGEHYLSLISPYYFEKPPCEFILVLMKDNNFFYCS